MKHRISPIVTPCLILAIVVMMLAGMLNSKQTSIPEPPRLTLAEGEYSVDGGRSWLPLEESRPLRRSRGDLILRGRTGQDLPAGEILNLSLQHMTLEAQINDQTIFSFPDQAAQSPYEYCAAQWVSVPLPALTAQDELTIRLEPLHLGGMDGSACWQLVEQMYLSDPFLLNQWLENQRMPQRLFGMLLTVAGVTLLGIAIAALIMKSPLHRILLYTALLAIGEGARWVLGAYAIVNGIGGMLAFANMGLSMSRVLAIYALMAGISQLLLHKTRISQWLVGVHGVISLGFILVSLLTARVFCSMELIWSAVQAPFLLAMLILCIQEVQIEKYSVAHRFFILAHMISFAAILFSLADQMGGWGLGVNVEKGVCGVMALCYASALFIQTPASHEAIQSAKKMAEELDRSRIVLAMSQIRTHFIFNVLNAISSLCKSDPDQADVELVRFSRYLRTNIDIMQEDKPISFEAEMDHVLNYVDLEQLRFDERIMVDEQYEVTDFTLPSLIVQPLVENAIKHGLLPKAEGGTIRLATYLKGQDVVIEIADDGVGFDAPSRSTHQSVGLSNVRFRVEKMAGGRLEIQSEPGKGTVVKVILPYRKEEIA